MSIFYKILLTPLLGFLIFALFLNYQQRVIYQNSKDIEKIKDVILPIIKITDKNLVILNDINRHYEDILVTADKEQIVHIEEKKSKIINNLNILKKDFDYQNSVEIELVNYINGSNAFVTSFIKDQGFTESNQKLMKKSMNSLKIVKNSLDKLDKDIKKEFEQKLYRTNETLKNNLKSGIFGFSAGFILILILVFNLASRISNSIKSVSKSLHFTNKDEDYLSLTLEKKSNDEIGELIGSFNDSIGFLQDMHKHVQSSINYASYIQESILPDSEIFDEVFDDYFVIWNPRDTVGGDIYFIEKLNDDESLLMVIDCTGHGVPGAFVTMIVKSITTEIVSKIKNTQEDISPSKILSYFNSRMQKLLKQDQDATKSNVGFDGGIIYINKKSKVLKFAGAETALFVYEDDKIKTIKGNRHSIGYKKSKLDYEFKEHQISIENSKKVYITTDGYLDQTGGEKKFCFGKKKFISLLENNIEQKFDKQKDILWNNIVDYQGTEDRKDDITVVGFEIK
jgi:serine phosphatase RsbU (regulator of sigma subunit)